MALTTESFEGSPGGMNLALPAQELDDTEARYIQDALVDFPGLTRRRGAVQPVTVSPVFTNKGTHPVLTLDPAGNTRIAVLNGDNSTGYFSAISADDLSKVDLVWPHPLPTSPAVAGQSYRIVDAKPALGSGSFIGVSSAYDSAAPQQGLALWMGANKANYSGTAKVARGSAAMTLPSGANANVVPGMWVFADTDDGYTQALIGYVKTVNSDTSITLGVVAPFNVGQSPSVFKTATFQALRGFAPKVITGRLTGDTNSTTITGGATKFKSQHLDVGTWHLYRASDLAFIGKIASVQSESSLTLAANAAVAMADDAYIALRADSDYSIETIANTNKVGFITATYAGRQWYANNGSQQEKTSRIWFSDTSDPEAIDLSDFDGDWDDVESTTGVNEPIRAMMPANTGLVIYKENETFIVTGASPTSFSPKKLEDDGAVSGMSVQPYGGGVIWAGREGIHFFDGIQVNNLTSAKLGDYWRNTVRTFDPTKDRMWSMIVRDHYFLHVENIEPPVGIVKGTTTTVPTRLTVAINMVTQAITLLTNVNLRGAVTLPASAGKSVWYLVNGKKAGDSSDHAFLADGEALFADVTANDVITADGGTAGPDFYFESKKFDSGDPTRLKKFKQLMLHYLVQGGDIKVDTVIGLNDLGQTLTGTFPNSVLTWDTLRASVSTWVGAAGDFASWDDLIQSVFKPKRVKFQKDSQHFSFRLWQSTNAIQRLKIGPYHIGYKLQRVGRV